MDENNKSLIINLIGINSYNYVVSHVLGNSSNKVDPYRHSNSESISTSVTYDRIIEGETEVLYELRKLTREVINRICEKNYCGKTVTITLRNLDFKTITRSKSVDDYLSNFDEIFDIVTELVESNYNGEQLRLLGVGVSNLVDNYNDKNTIFYISGLADDSEEEYQVNDNIPKEYNLFTISDKDTKDYVVKNLIKEFQQKYGEKALFIKK